MPGVVVREDEPFESAIRRFKKQLQRSGVLGEAKRRRAYDKPSVKKKKKSILACEETSQEIEKNAQVWVIGPKFLIYSFYVDAGLVDPLGGLLKGNPHPVLTETRHSCMLNSCVCSNIEWGF